MTAAVMRKMAPSVRKMMWRGRQAHEQKLMSEVWNIDTASGLC